MITICLTYFRSLALANLDAALYSIGCQDLSRVDEIVVLDNNTDDLPIEVRALVAAHKFPVPTVVKCAKHGDPSKTHAWSTNYAVGCAKSEWVLFTRADYLLDSDLVTKFTAIVGWKGADWDGFVVSDGYHLNADVGVCEMTDWRHEGLKALRKLPGSIIDYPKIDAGVWMARRHSFAAVGGLDERLTAWGHAQTVFQYRMQRYGVGFERIPEVLFYHPQHAADRDIDLANAQLAENGIDLHELWKRHEGSQPYK